MQSIRPIPKLDWLISLPVSITQLSHPNQPQINLVRQTYQTYALIPTQSISPTKQQPKSDTIEFRAKPMKRQQSDMLNFKEIFIDPRQQVLSLIKSKSSKNQHHDQPLPAIKNVTEIEDNQSSDIQSSDIQSSDIPYHFQQCIHILDRSPPPQQLDFYQEQIKIQPPDLPNSSIASTLAPGSGYAPSIPINTLNKNTNLKQLLMRAKAGMNTQDIQKQSHLAYFLGAVYEQRGEYLLAVKFYRRLLGFAKSMQDKIGMALASNRIGINYFNHGDMIKSISFHNDNLKLSDQQNCFCGFYNLGICYRMVEKYNEALQHFQIGLKWAQEKPQLQSECISYGQLAITYKKMELYQQCLENLQKSLDIAHKLKNTKLQLLNLRNILVITSTFNLRSTQNLFQLAQEAYQCAIKLEDKKMIEILSCNLGIIMGRQDFKERKMASMGQSDIEECD